MPCWCTALCYPSPKSHLLFLCPFCRWRNCSLVRWNDLVQKQKAVGRAVTMTWSLYPQLCLCCYREGKITEREVKNAIILPNITNQNWTDFPEALDFQVQVEHSRAAVPEDEGPEMACLFWVNFSINFLCAQPTPLILMWGEDVVTATPSLCSYLRRQERWKLTQRNVRATSTGDSVKICQTPTESCREFDSNCFLLGQIEELLSS